MLFENEFVGEMVDFNLKKSRGMFSLEHLPFEYLLFFIKNLSAKDIVVLSLLPPPTAQLYLLMKYKHIYISFE